MQMSIRMTANWTLDCRHVIAMAVSLAWLSLCGEQAVAQRLLGIDISAHQGNIFLNPTGNPSDSNWVTLNGADNRDFAFIRASRGGTTGYDHRQGGYPSGNNTAFNLSQRYDDPYFVQNINRATSVGMYAGPYHRSRADIIATTTNSGGIANTGTDDSNHFIQMAGAFMRPGYMVPVLDFEDGDGIRTDQEMAQFALDFSNRIYAVMQIRPAIYINGNYAANVVGGGTASQRSELAQQSSTPPSLASPAFPTLWTARWPNQTNPNAIDVQNSNPKDHIDAVTGTGTPTVYGPWDDYGVAQPWSFWQYASTAKLSGYKNGTTNIDVDVSRGDVEYLKDSLVPAIWWNDSSGDWSTQTNWNSGQPVVAPAGPPGVPSCGTCSTGTGQLTPIGTQTLPTPRLPGTAGSGPAVTSGVNDTVILERPNANITVTLSNGSYSVRKLYMRETLNITGGSLTINYDPNYVSDTVNYPNAMRSGPISAQFSGPVSISGSGSLNANTLQVDASQTFTLAGSAGTLTFKAINLLPSAKIAVTGDVNINPLSNATATISGSSGNVDLSGGTRIFNVGNGSSDVDLDVDTPFINGGLTKSGAGTMRLSGSNTFAGAVTVNAGVLRSNNATGFSSSSVITVNNGGTLDMNGIADTVSSLGGTSGGVITQGAVALTLGATSGSNTFSGAITGTGAFTKNGAATQILNGNNSLGPVAVNAGSLLFNGANTTGAVTVGNGGTLGGTGSVSGAVTLNSGGHVAPGASIESLGVGALSLVTGSVLDIELDGIGSNDSINVSGLLTLNGGSVNLTNLGSWDVGTYTLISYGSINLINNLSAPTGGPSNFNFDLINTGSAIQLSVTLPGDFNLDSTVDGADYLVWSKSGGSQSNYDLWRTNFGRAAGDGSGSGASLGGEASVPEPATALLVACGLLPFIGCRFLRRK